MLRFKYDCPHDALTSIAFTLPYMAYEITMFCQVMSQTFQSGKKEKPARFDRITLDLLP